MVKQCSECGDYKLFSDFHKNKRCKYGLNSWCKDCIKEYQREHREENKEKLKEYQREYYEENKEKLKECQREYYEENKEKINECQRKHLEELKDTVFEYYGGNPPECRYCGGNIALALYHRCGDEGKYRKNTHNFRRNVRREARDLFESDLKKARRKFQMLCSSCNSLKGKLEFVIAKGYSDKIIVNHLNFLLSIPGIDKDRILEDFELIKEYYYTLKADKALLG